MYIICCDRPCSPRILLYAASSFSLSKVKDLKFSSLCSYSSLKDLCATN